ncbi:hypothetical protein ACOME3_003624 [Neoechinorhynchus agilis]
MSTNVAPHVQLSLAFVTTVRCFGMLIIIFGTIGNLLSILVLTRPRLRKQPTAVYLTALAFSDIGIIYFIYFTHYLSFSYRKNVRLYSSFLCKLSCFTSHTFLQLSPALLALVSVQRLLTVKNPSINVPLICNLNMSKIIISTVALISALANCHFLVFYRLQHDSYDNVSFCGPDSRYSAYRYFLSRIHPRVILFSCVIGPSFTMIICNFKLGRHVLKTTKGVFRDSASETNSTLAGQSKRRQNRQKSLTIMLTSVSAVYILFTAPAIFVYLLFRHDTIINSFSLRAIIWAVVNMLLTLNTVANFVLYFLAGNVFRSELKLVKTCGANCKWKRNGEDENWPEHAIDALYKRLKKKKGEVEKLVEILSNPSSISECVTIPRSMDGRIQYAANRKCLPHVLYCRLWRWPDLSNCQELRSVPNCDHPYQSENKNSKDICINPYHYIRLTRAATTAASTNLPPVLVPCYNQFPAVSEQTRANENQPFSTADNVQSGAPISANNQDIHQHSAYVPYEPQSNWCMIAYHELNQRVGPVFFGNSPTIQVDGYTNPLSSDFTIRNDPLKSLIKKQLLQMTNAVAAPPPFTRFSLGPISSLFRNSTTKKVRTHIGKGILLTQSANSLDVYLQVLGSHPVFVRSRILNGEQGFLDCTVVKMHPGTSLRVFSEAVFYQTLTAALQCGPTENCVSPFDAVYDLIGCCKFSLSFIKGWGNGYARSDISSTPCWLEVHLNGPLSWLDNILATMGCAQSMMSSRT